MRKESKIDFAKLGALRRQAWKASSLRGKYALPIARAAGSGSSAATCCPIDCDCRERLCSLGRCDCSIPSYNHPSLDFLPKTPNYSLSLVYPHALNYRSFIRLLEPDPLQQRLERSRSINSHVLSLRSESCTSKINYGRGRYIHCMDGVF